jgi:hypothetical protein
VFEFAQLLGDGERSIALQTHLGRDIPNAVGAEITDYHRRRFQLIVERHGQSWVIRKEAAPWYNCGGHVWASRRTCVYELDPAWSMILADDGYRRTHHPQADDLVFYVDEDRRILHVGRILELRRGVSPDAAQVPWAVSKWSDWSGEVVHSVYHHPYDPRTYPAVIQYWTDRPTRSEELSA